MVLRPRKASRVEDHRNDGKRIVDNDDKKKRRKIRRTGFSWLFRIDTQQLRFGVVVLLIANLYIYNKNKNSPIISCQDVISSFTSWRQHFLNSPPLDGYYDGLSFPNFGRSGRFPSITERTQYYMGHMWFHPKLQGVPPSSPFGPYWLERYKHAADNNHNYHHQQQPILIDTRNSSKIYDCAKQNHERACQAILFQSNNPLETALPLQQREVLLNVMDASFLVQEWYSLSFLSHLWKVWWYEGVVGFLYEVYLQCSSTKTLPKPHVPAYLWNLDLSHLSIATTLWNSQTPVFGRFRDDSSSIHHSTLLWPFIGDRPEKLPKSKNNHQQQEESKNHRQIVCWNPQKTNINLEFNNDEFINLMDRVIAEANFKSVHVIQEQEEDVSSCHLFLVLNDHAPDPNLVWKLFHTVLIMPSPIRYQSWIMEPFLQPYLQYVPLLEQHKENEQKENDVYSTVLKQLLWVQANPAESQKIDYHSTLWIYDLFFHPQSFREEELIMRTIIYRYQQFVLRAKPVMPSIWDLFTRQLLRLRQLVQSCLQWLSQDWLRLAILVVILLYYPCVHLY